MVHQVVKKGGIQPGTVSMDEMARALDNSCKDLKEALAPKFPNLTMQKKLTQDQIPGGIGACEPDGGLWFRGEVLVAVFEAKKQGWGGNAIERWFKNEYICRKINPDVTYVTFGIGEGAQVGGSIHKALAVAHPKGFNKYNPGGNACFLSVDGFDDAAIRRKMTKVLKSLSD